MNLRTLKAPAVAAALLLLAAAGCTDPTVAPKSTVTSANIWTDPSSYQAYMAKMYAGLILTGQVGPNASGFGNGDIAGIDEGTSEFLRLLWYMEEVPTDEAVIGWNDDGLPPLNRWTWNASNTMTNAMYYRVYYEAVLVNEFLRQTTASVLASRGNVTPTLMTQIQQYRAEARFLRAYAYWVGMNFFGNIPLVTEADPIGGAPPKQVAKDSIYRYVVGQVTAIIDSLPAATAANYGRATKMAAHMLLANLYLNAQVYTGTANYAGALAEAATVIGSGSFSLNPVFRNNFTADNNLSPELIWVLQQDGTHSQTWGGMTFMVHAACGGSDTAAKYGMDYCWGGYRMKQQAYNRYSAGDARAAFFVTTGHQVNADTIGAWSNGISAPKFTNKTSTGGNGQQLGMVDADFPIFRLAEAYLIYAEAAVRTSTNLTTGLGYFNAIRERAFGNTSADLASTAQMTLDTILAERGRELLFEAKRRTDLIRYGYFVDGTHLWAWKGGVVGGQAMSPNYMLYAIPANELSNNPNLTQNPGY